MGKMNIEANKGKVTDIKGNIDAKQKELKNLEQRKQDIMDAHNDVDAANIDEKTQQLVFEALANVRQEISERGQELSDQLNGDSSMLEEMAQEVNESKGETEAERKKLEQKKALLDKIGLGASLESGISEMDESITQLEDLQSSISETSQEVRNLQTQLGML